MITATPPDLLTILTFVVSILLPLLVGLVTKVVTHSGVKAILLAFLSAVLGFLNELIRALTTGDPFDLWTAVILWVGIFIIAVGMHFGVWRPIGASTKAQAALGGGGAPGPNVV